MPSCSSCWRSAHAATGDALFAARADETVAWLTREMLVDGAFASALDADSEGEEGRFYVWNGAEIDRLLGADAPAFRLAYGVTDAGNWEGHNVLNRLHECGLPARRRRSPGERAAQHSWPRASGGSGPAATTRCSPTGTA